MEGLQDIKDIIDERWVDAGADVQTTIAVRAMFRTLPLLMLYSETLRKTAAPVAAFGFLPEQDRRAHLLTLMQAYSIAAVLAQRKHPMEPLSFENYTLFNAVIAVFWSDFEGVREVKESAQFPVRELSPEAKDLAASNNLACSIFNSVACFLYSLKHEFHVAKPQMESAAEVVMSAAEAARQCALAAVAAREFAAAGEFTGTTGTTVATALAHTRYLETRSIYYAEAVAAVALDLGQPLGLVTFVETAKATAVAYASLALVLEAGDLGALSAALTVALAAAASYEDARLATLPFYEQINFDIFLAPDIKLYESVQFVHGEGFATAAAAAFILVAETAESAAGSFAAAAQGSLDYDLARSNFRLFAAACDAIDSHLASAAADFNPALRYSAMVIADFSWHEENLSNVHSWWERYNTVDIYWRTLEPVLESIAAYAEHKLCDLNESFVQSLLADLDFLKDFSCSELRAREIWLPARATGDSSPELERSRFVGIAIWQELWAIFRREALAIEPGTQRWLDWCDDLFAGNANYLANLESVLGCPCTPGMDIHSEASNSAEAGVL